MTGRGSIGTKNPSNAQLGKGAQMTRRVLLTAVFTMAFIAAGKAEAADPSALMVEIAAKANTTIAFFRGTMVDELGSRMVLGPAICISTKPDIFITIALDTRIDPKTLSDFVLNPPGRSDVSVKAELLGIDPETGIAFLRGIESYQWTAVEFTRKSNLTVGQPVVSLGLWPEETGFEPYLGFAYFSSFVRMPQQTAYVTGGLLTNIGSVVFNADGKAIGLISGQRFLNYQTVINERMTNLSLKSQQLTSFFLPVEEFAYVLETIPTSPQQVRRLPWIGVLGFSGVSKEVAEIMNLDRPGVMIDNIIPDYPAAKAGLKDRDVIIAVNDKPLQRLGTSDLVAADLERQLLRMQAGANVKLTVMQGQETKDVTVKLEEMPQRPDEANRYLDQKLGMLIREKVDLDKYTGSKTQLAGVIVMLLGQDAPATRANIQPGDVITGANSQSISSLDDYKKVVTTAVEKDPSKSVVFSIRRGEQDMSVSVNSQ